MQYDDDDVAIDFRLMLEQERARARAGREKKKEEPTNHKVELKSLKDTRTLTLSPRKVFDKPTVCVGKLRSLYYAANYLSTGEHDALLGLVQDVHDDKWTLLNKRRLQQFGGLDASVQPLPPWLASVSAMLTQAELFSQERPVNNVLINEYAPGDGIMPHSDGPFYHPFVCILSLGAPCVMKFYKDSASTKQENGESISVLLEPHSLLVFTDELYNNYLHAIADVSSEPIPLSCVNVPQSRIGETIKRGTRVSLTLRHIPSNALP